MTEPEHDSNPHKGISTGMMALAWLVFLVLVGFYFQEVLEERRIRRRARVVKRLLGVVERLLEELKEAPSVLRLSYLGDIEPESLVADRLKTLEKTITAGWKQPKTPYPLNIEKEVFWRRGAPVTRGLSEASEKHLPVDQPVTEWFHDPADASRWPPKGPW